jgi:hypothetical protein
MMAAEVVAPVVKMNAAVLLAAGVDAVLISCIVQ